MERTIQELDAKKAELLSRANELVLIHKKLYSNIDIKSPMSKEEKDLEKQIANIYSQINSIILEKRKIKQITN